AVDTWRVMRHLLCERPVAVHVLAQYRDALPREVMVATLCALLRVPFVYDIKGGMFVEAFYHRGKWYRWGIGFIVKRAVGILGEGRTYLDFLASRYRIAATYFPNFVPAAEVPAKVPD